MDYEFLCQGHNSIYQTQYQEENYNKRNFKVYVTVPNTQEEVGVLLLIAGFGGNANSNIYKKMRRELANTYNLVTIQCDYFGWEFMQSSLETICIPNKLIEQLENYMDPIDYKKLYEKMKDRQITIQELVECKITNVISAALSANIKETGDNFNDMSYMQALDNITATLVVLNKLLTDGYKVNTNKIIINGNSQGAYLAYLCNRMCPNLYTHILDNSAWDYPKYFRSNRVLNIGTNMMKFKIDYNYIAKNFIKDVETLKISNLYGGFKNTCNIISYHGVDDTLITIEEKKEQLEGIDNVHLNIITQEHLKNGVFRSTEHGLNADFLKIFELFYKNYVEEIESKEELAFSQKVYLYRQQIEIDYTSGLPYVNNLKNT